MLTSKSPALLILFLLVASFNLNANEYWVAKTGSDANSCTNAANDACLTIQKGVSLLSLGDTLNVKAGTYSDDGGTSPFAPDSTFCGWLDSEPPSSNICINMNGTPSNPIIIQAAPGDEGQVIIDAQNNKIGIHLQNSNYIHIRGFKIINNRTIGIASWGQVENNVADANRLSIGVIIENNNIINTTGHRGKNTSGIGMWGTKDWIVRNNLIDGVSADGGTLASGIQSYGVINALIENNHLKNVDFGIFWKDHFINDMETRASIFESEIRYNEINSYNRGINISIKGTNTVEAGENYIHHNIIYGLGSSSTGINIAMRGAHSISGKMRIEHNLIDGENKSSFGIAVDSSKDLTISGNIITRTDLDYEFISQVPTKRPHLNFSNYNIFKNNMKSIIDRYSNTSVIFSSLNEWRAAASNLSTLNFSNPDTQSITSNPSALFVDIDSKNYRSATNSPALRLMPDGSNAGPYQQGDEIIGLFPNWPAYGNSAPPQNTVAPMPPGNVQVNMGQ